MDSPKMCEKSQCASLQQSSSQFFYFLRLMELFPDTHPATLHTVLTLCKNNFFSAVDKLLYAKRCKSLYNRRQNIFQRFAQQNRTHPYCSYNKSAPTVTTFHTATSKNDASSMQKADAIIIQEHNSISKSPTTIISKEDLISKENCILSDSKDEVEIALPCELQQQYVIPMRPISPVSDIIQDLSSNSIRNSNTNIIQEEE